MPDRKRGYVKRKKGILASDDLMADMYRSVMTQDMVEFTGETQLAIIDTVLESRSKQGFECYYIATEVSHAHLLVGWCDERTWRRMRSIIKSSLTRALSDTFGRREWFVEGGSRKRVKDRKHFEYLVSKYLPQHGGWKWCPERGKFP
jgi:hypothetical protein